MSIPSSLSEVGSAVLEVSAFVKTQGVFDLSSIEIVCRELLANAISHGNNNSSDKYVEVIIEKLARHQIKLTVSDQGTGFDHTNLTPTNSYNSSINDRRGYQLIKSLCTKIIFNKTGNQVTAIFDIEFSCNKQQFSNLHSFQFSTTQRGEA